MLENSNDWPYEQVYFSVVRHPQNRVLDTSIEAFRDLTAAHGQFFAFTPEPILGAVDRAKAPALREWARWYRELYAIAG